MTGSRLLNQVMPDTLRQGWTYRTKDFLHNRGKQSFRRLKRMGNKILRRWLKQQTKTEYYDTSEIQSQEP